MVTLLSAVGLVLVAGLTAWETQNLKRQYYALQHDGALAEKASIFGAVSLYISFINIFLMLYNLFGRSN